MTEVKLCIGVPTAEFSKQAIFYDHFDSIIKPAGTLIVRPHGQSPAKNRNIVIEHALNGGYTHVLFIDDDTIPPTDIFTRLVAHDLDMVTGLYPMRNYPHQNIIFDYADSAGRCRHFYVPDGVSEGLVPLVAAGFGAILIKTDVFRKLEAPWVRLGELDGENWSDDIGFFKRTREAGFQLWGDVSVRCGHMATMVVRNEYKDGKWMTTYDTSGTANAGFPMYRPVLSEALV